MVQDLKSNQTLSAENKLERAKRFSNSSSIQERIQNIDFFLASPNNTIYFKYKSKGNSGDKLMKVRYNNNTKKVEEPKAFLKTLEK